MCSSARMKKCKSRMRHHSHLWCVLSVQQLSQGGWWWCSLLVLVLLLPVTVVAVHYVAPEDCEWKPLDRSGNDVALTCQLRTVNGAFDSTNFSLIQPEHTASLMVRCDDVLFESSLVNNSFAHLKELRSLHIERCKLRDIPPLAFHGLSQLRNLTLRTHNNEWGEITLRLYPEAFSALHMLERLDLSLNNLASLSESLFCPLSNIELLNLTYNDFVEVFSLGFAPRHREKPHCQVRAQHLDLSFNRLKVLTDKGFAALSQLRVLNLRHNHVSRAEETALSGLGSLQLLDLSNNQLVALPPRFFQPTEQLAELYLQNNSISVLPPGLFNGLQQMVILDLSHNEITSHWIGPDTFADLIRLVILDLSHNKLNRIDSSTFRSQYSLHILKLHNNEIDSISENAFSSLYNLQTLVLSHNRLTRIDSFTLSGLYVLSMLAMDNNEIDSIHLDAFRNISNLMELNLAVNKLTTVPQAIMTLQFLRSLDVSYNQISETQNATYLGLQHLYSLNLMANQVGNLSKGFFQDLPSLRILNIANNKIQAIEQGTFDDVPDLHALRLDSNYIADINGLFSNLRDLLMLNISANRITWFDYALIPIGLQWLDIHDNQIKTLGNYFELESVLKLRTLDASFNKITEIDSSSLPDGIEIIYLQSNVITRIHPFTFMGKPNLTRVDLTKNNLQNLDINAFRLTKVPNRKPLPEFSVSGNPYLCDCNMEWLQRIGTLDESRQYPRMVDVDDIICQLAFTRRKAVVPLIKADSSQFLCRYKNHCFALCHCCEFDACDCEMVCPENCTCYYDQSWNTNIVDCSAQGHTVVPQRIPMDVTELYLDGNNIPMLSSHTFIGRKNLKILYLNSSDVQIINNRTFNGLKSLQILNLQHNRITTLHGFEFERLQDLRELYLSYNHISTISNNTFLPLKSLQILYVDHNFIVEFQAWNLNTNLQLRDVKLAHNLWSCECDFVDAFSDWLQVQGAQVVRDLDELQCYHNETTTLPLIEFNMTACTNYSAQVFAQKFQVENLMPMLIIGASAFVLLLFIVILGFVYRKEVSVWFYTRYGLRVYRRNTPRGEEEKLFDAFVSYSKKDEAFVSQILAPELECGNPPYRLCLHYRDLPVGSYLSDVIIEAMESSRRTIVIISENFLKSEWCRFEFKSAHHEVLRTSKHKLIVILLGRIAPKDLDPDIRVWLKTNTFLRWGEKMFWEKLRYCMPDAPNRKTERNRSDVTVAVHI